MVNVSKAVHSKIFKLYKGNICLSKLDSSDFNAVI